MLIEGLLALGASPRDVLGDLVGLGGILDALADRAGAAHHLDGGHAAVALLVGQEPQRNHGLEVVRDARGRIVHRLTADGSAHSVEYDSGGRPSVMTSPSAM